MNNPLKQFFASYIKGDIANAVREIIPLPEAPLGSKQNLLLKHLENFVDAAVFRPIKEAGYQFFVLLEVIKKDPLFNETFKDVVDQLDFEKVLFEWLFAHEDLKPTDRKDLSPFYALFSFEEGLSVLNESDLTEILVNIPFRLREVALFHYHVALGWNRLLKSKQHYLNSLPRPKRVPFPWFPIKYSISAPSINLQQTKSLPFIFLEPIDQDLSNFFDHLTNQPAVFVVSTLSVFYQLLQIPKIIDALSDPQHLIYILDIYPNAQLLNQQAVLNDYKNFYPIYFSPSKHLELFWPYLEEAFRKCFVQDKQLMTTESPLANDLYQLSKHLLYSIQQDRLGNARQPALYVQFEQLKWYDSHKALTSTDKLAGPKIKDHIQSILEDYAKLRRVRHKEKKDKLRIAHIVPQIISLGHAPTRLLENLVLNYDKDQFDLMVVSSEILLEHPFEYPLNYYRSESSVYRGFLTIQKFQQMGIEVFINNQSFTYASDAVSLAEYLNGKDIDIAVFHGPDVVNLISTQLLSAPLRVLFEHGSQSSYAGFDLAIVSSDAAVELYQKHYADIGTRVVGLPFAVDVRKDWSMQEKPITKASMKMPETALIMTTISTKLDSRLSDEMCSAITEILKRVPNAYYAPIGNIENIERLQRIFNNAGVLDRLKFLGTLRLPSLYARSMHLYLNEFPFGSCLGILDAMASGLPVVTMYDARGPQQARYGGDFIGIDRAITSGNEKEYVELACSLLTDQYLYNEWSAHTLRQYEKFSDVKKYVKSFEKILLNS